MSFESWLGSVLLLQFGVAGAVILRFGLRLSWTESVIAAACFVILQIAFVMSMPLIGRHTNDRARAGSVIVALYLITEGILVIYFGSRWGLMKSGACWFAAIFTIMIATVFLLPSRWTENLGLIKCARCRHYHEGQNCRCGCRAEQFKYPAMSAPP